MGRAVSVIIPTVDRPAMLRDALDSVLSQTISDIEVLVVFDGTPPPSAISADPRVEVLSTGPQRLGPAAARNVGLRAAGGTHIAFLDDDDLWTTDRLEVALPHADAVPVVVTWSRYRHESSGSGRRLSGHVGDTILDGLTPSLGAVLVERHAALDFDEHWRAVEDLDWWLRMARQHPLTTHPRVTHLVRRHDGPRWGNGAEDRINENLELLEAHSVYFQNHPRARAFRLWRTGLLAQRSGAHSDARRLHRRSLAARPTVRAAWHLARTLAPRRAGR